MSCALKAQGQRAFYRWVQKELKGLFPRLPERTRLFRLLQQHASATQHFLAGTPSCLKICDRGAWNERMLVETLFSLFTNVLHMKKLSNRVWSALRARLAYTVAAYTVAAYTVAAYTVAAYTVAAYNLCTAWNGEIKLELAPFAL